MVSSSKFLMLVLIVGSLSGCSVSMALSGDRTPDLDVIKIGALRDDVEFQLGQPDKIEKLSDSAEVAVYKYETDNDPSALRAVGHAALDVASLGIWEVVGTPIEASTGKEHEVMITYDKFRMVTNITRS